MNFQDTLNNTPQPSAWSTEAKSDLNISKMTNMNQVRKKLYDLSSSDESLGILSLASGKNSMIDFDSEKNLLEEREKSKHLLEKLKSRTNLFESTVNEHDLLHTVKTSNATMNSPCNSTVSESDLLGSRYSNIHKHDEGNSMKEHSVSRYIEELKAKFRCNTTASFNQILADHSKNSILQLNDSTDYEKSSFVPASQCKEQLNNDEKHWQQQFAIIPVDNTKTSFLPSEQTTFDDKVSIGEFFKGRSENCSNIFGRSSPPQRLATPLVNSTTIEEDAINNTKASVNANETANNILSLSDIRNLLSSNDCTPNKVLERLMNPKTRSQESINKDDFFNGAFDTPNAMNSMINSKMDKPYASIPDLRPTKLVSSSMKSLSYMENKENVPETERNRTISSMRTSSSMATIPEGSEKVSIASTKSELIWGCIREGRSNTQSFTIRNKHRRRVIYNVHSSNSNYKLADCQSIKSTIVLHPLETRELQVIFNPITIGPQVGHLLFTPVIHKREQTSMQQRIALFGYGGHVSIDVKGQTRDLCGKLWVSLGHIEGKQVMVAEFYVTNHGTIDGFASFTVSGKSLCAYEDVEIEPCQVIVKRGAEKKITVRFRPSKSDLALLSNSLSNKTVKTAEIGVIKMISGADINRQRIVKVNKKIQKEYHLKCDPLQQQLANKFHGARTSDDINCFNESVGSSKILMQSLDSTEISLLVDRDPDDSLLPESDDTTVIFKTLVCPHEDTMVQEPKTDNSFMKYFNFEPLMLILTPPTKFSDIILLTSHYSKTVSYQISVIPDDVLILSNRQGELVPEETKLVQVSCGTNYCAKQRQDFKVLVDIEYECISSLVSIIPNL